MQKVNPLTRKKANKTFKMQENDFELRKMN
mgnify:CR=1 FL=1